MKNIAADQVRCFDPAADYAIATRRLPHWSQAGAVSFITWRTWDSIPVKVLAAWTRDGNLWLAHRGIDAAAHD